LLPRALFCCVITQEIDDDLELLGTVLRIIQLLSSKVHSFNQKLVDPSIGSLAMLLNHASRLTAILTAKSQGTLTHRELLALSPSGRASPASGSGPKADNQPSAALASVVSVLLTVVRSKRALVRIFKLQHCPTIMELCGSSHKKVRRGGGTLLQRLSTLKNSKIWLHASGVTPLLLKLLAEKPDEVVIHTAATTLCGSSFPWFHFHSASHRA
jgi:hypothetical protein